MFIMSSFSYSGGLACLSSSTTHFRHFSRGRHCRSNLHVFQSLPAVCAAPVLIFPRHWLGVARHTMSGPRTVHCISYSSHCASWWSWICWIFHPLRCSVGAVLSRPQECLGIRSRSGQRGAPRAVYYTSTLHYLWSQYFPSSWFRWFCRPKGNMSHTVSSSTSSSGLREFLSVSIIPSPFPSMRQQAQVPWKD